MAREARAVPTTTVDAHPQAPAMLYLFAQQHRDGLPWWGDDWRPQRVTSGARLRIHLPGDPIRWVPDTSAACQPTPFPGRELWGDARIELIAQAVVASPGRIEGAASLYVFDYRVGGAGVAAACLRPDPVSDDPTSLGFPPGSPLSYALTVIVGR